MSAVDVVFIGQAPSRTAGHARAFDGLSGARLAKIADVDLEAFLRSAVTLNLLTAFPGRRGKKGDAFDVAAARARAAELTAALSRKRVVFVGRRVADAFGFTEAEPCVWSDHATFSSAAFIPHPSGLNVFYNSPTNRRIVGKFVRTAVGLSPLTGGA